MDTRSTFSRASASSPYGTRSLSRSVAAGYATTSGTIASGTTTSVELVRPVAARPAGSQSIAASQAPSPAGRLSLSPRGERVSSPAAPRGAVVSPARRVTAASGRASAATQAESAKRKRDENVGVFFNQEAETYRRVYLEVSAELLASQKRCAAELEADQRAQAAAMVAAQDKPHACLVLLVERGFDRTRAEFFMTVAHVAIETDWTALRQVPESMRDEDLCVRAIGRNERALAFVPASLRGRLTQGLAEADGFLNLDQE